MAAFFGFGAWSRLRARGRFAVTSVPLFGAAAFSLGLSLMFLSDMTGASNFVRSDFERELAAVQSEEHS
jgi:hypothetical protein